MLEYGIVAENDFREFVEAVNHKLLQGWRPQGGVCFVPGDDEHYATYMQAIVIDRTAEQPADVDGD